MNHERVDLSGSEGGSAARSVSQRLIDTLSSLIDRLGVMYRAEVEEYARMRDEDLASEVLQVTRNLLETFLHATAAGEAPVVDERLRMVELGRRRMEMGISLDAMLHIFRIIARGVFNAVAECVEPGEEAALAVLGSQWLEYVDSASSSAAISYLHASHNQMLQIEARARVMVEAVLAVNDAGEAAAVGAEFSVHLAESYVPCCLPPSTRREAVSAAMPAGSLLSSRGDVLLVLVPTTKSDPGWLGTSGVEVASHGGSGRLGPDLRAEVARAEALLEIAVQRGFSGVVGPEDFVIEQLLASGPEIVRVIRRQVLSPLVERDSEGVLQRTLEAYFQTGSLIASAKQCHTHTNTVTYRLRRVAQLTGLDPRVPLDATKLVLALAARR